MDAAQHQYIQELYYEMYDPMLSYARSNLPSEDLAEEAVQEAFRVACQKPEQVCQSPNPRGWLVQTLKFIIRNIKASQDTTARLIERYAQNKGDDLLGSTDTLALRTLYGNIVDTEEFRLLVEMAIEGRSHLEMAQKRGISVDACKKRVQRAKEYLRQKIKI